MAALEAAFTPTAPAPVRTPALERMVLTLLVQTSSHDPRHISVAAVAENGKL